MQKDADSKKTNLKTSTRKLIFRAMELWRIYGANYSTAVDAYKALLQRKRDLKMRPLGKIPDYVLKEYPDIPFLKIRGLTKQKLILKSLTPRILGD